jgi:hypothetical protein
MAWGAVACILGCSVKRTPPPGGAAADTAAARRELEGAVRAELEGYYADFSARDWVRFADHFWPGATITTVWQPPGEPAARVAVQTVPDFVAKAPEGPGSRPIFEERMTGLELRVHGNLAQAWARYQARFGDAANVMEWRGVDAITLFSHQGRWRIVSLAFTDLDAPVTDRR